MKVSTGDLRAAAGFKPFSSFSSLCRQMPQDVAVGDVGGRVRDSGGIVHHVGNPRALVPHDLGRDRQGQFPPKFRDSFRS